MNERPHRSSTWLAIIALLLALVVAPAAFAQEWEEDGNPMATYDQALGGAFGPIIGTGLSYQRWFDGVGLQTAFGATYSPEDSWTGDLLWYLTTVGLQRMLYHETFADWFAGGLYAFGGVSHRGVIPWVYPNDYDNPDAQPTVGAYEPYVAIGGGVGIESVLFRHFSIPVEFGLSVEWQIPSIIPSSAGFIGGVGLRYRF